MIGTFTGDLDGWPFGLTVAGGGVLTAVAVGLPLLAEHRTQRRALTAEQIAEDAAAHPAAFGSSATATSARRSWFLASWPLRTSVVDGERAGRPARCQRQHDHARLAHEDVKEQAQSCDDATGTQRSARVGTGGPVVLRRSPLALDVADGRGHLTAPLRHRRIGYHVASSPPPARTADVRVT